MNDLIEIDKAQAIINRINDPAELRNYSQKQLEELAAACRSRIVDVVSKTGGHLASSLGTVEMTIALFSMFDFKDDRLVWDVGHQAYTHKMLTGRNMKFEQLGQKNGLGKFLRLDESEYDHFGAGHASTSISAGLGIAVSSALVGKERKTIAVIGDGAMTGGLAFEALNHAGHLDKDLIVILNDNEMSIEPNVGALSKTFTNVQSSKTYNMVRDELVRHEKDNKLSQLVVNAFKKVNESVTALMTPGAWFEKFDFRYFGPIDGHNIKAVRDLLEKTKDIKGPILLHLLTKKGKGYSHAEDQSPIYHGVSAFDPKSGKFIKKQGNGRSYTSIFSDAIESIMERDDKVVATSAAMIGNTGLGAIFNRFPERVFDVGIAEGHAVTFSAGLSLEEIKPFVVIYSTFMQRAIDHVLHDVALQNLPVKFILDRGGFVGPDGATHHGALDLTYMRMVPGMVLMAPRNGVELHKMMNTVHQYNEGPITLRFPRGNTDVYLDEPDKELGTIPIGKGELLSHEGDDLLLLAVGSMVTTAENVAQKLLNDEGVKSRVIDARYIKPLDADLILKNAKEVKGIVTLEENSVIGGFGAGILELFQQNQVWKPVKRFGIPDQFIEFGSTASQLEEAGLDEASVYADTLSYFRSL